MTNVVSLEDARLARQMKEAFGHHVLGGAKPVSRELSDALRLRPNMTYALLHEPLTPAVIDALERLNDAELEALFRARARAKLADHLADPADPA